MANKKTDMSKLIQILRLYTQGEKKLKISTLTGISRNTLKKYLKIYLRLGLTPKDIDALSDLELDRLFGENLVPELCEKYKTLEAFFPAIEKQLRRRGVTREALWVRYIAVHPGLQAVTVQISLLPMDKKNQSCNAHRATNQTTKNEFTNTAKVLEPYIFSSYHMSADDFTGYLAEKYISDRYQKEIFLRKVIWLKVSLNYIAALILTQSGNAILTPKEIREIVRQILIPSIYRMNDSNLSGLILTQDVHDNAKKE